MWPILEDAGPVTAYQRKLAHEAADEIERLREELSRSSDMSAAKG